MWSIPAILVAVSAEEYCPSAGDITVAYGNPSIRDQGWDLQGDCGAATKASFNLLGGYVEFDVDMSGVGDGINANIYSISPNFNGEFNKDANYCDGQENDSPWCMEHDWIESSGHCGGATTWHTRQGEGQDGCSAWGCYIGYLYNGKTSFHMKVEYGTDGMATVHRDGQVLGGWDPAPGGNEWQITQQIFQQDGGVVYSSQWGGWVPHEHDPLQGCPQSGGNIDGSHFSVSNLRISGSVVHGPEPSRCSSPSPSPPSPSPAPAPTPAGQCQVSDCKNNDGTNLKSTAESASSADQCCDKCKSATGCVGWTWVKDNGECWLKSSVSAARDDDCGCCVTSGTYSAPAPVPSPAPTPVPVPSPVPTPTDCPGGSLANCIKGCPTDATVFQICVAECDKRCESATSCTGGDDGSSLETCVKGCPSDSYMDCVTCCSGKFPSMLML